MLRVLGILLVLAPAAFAQDPLPPRPPRGGTSERKPTGLEPKVFSTWEEAIENARKRKLPVVAAVGMAAAGEAPAVFSDRLIAAASRATLSLVSLEYFAEDPFFKTRHITADKVPCILILDTHGNVLDTRTPNEEPRIIAACAREVRTRMNAIQAEIPKIVRQAEALAQEKKTAELLALLRPWLQKHYAGYDGVPRLVELAVAAGTPSLEEAKKLPPDKAVAALESVAKEFADTPVEAAALLQVARLHEAAANRDAARKILRHIVDGLLWPENEAIIAQARTILAAYRKEEIERRLAEEQKRKEAAK